MRLHEEGEVRSLKRVAPRPSVLFAREWRDFAFKGRPTPRICSLSGVSMHMKHTRAWDALTM